MGMVGAFRSPQAAREYLDAYDAVVSKSPMRVEQSTVATPFGETYVLSAGSADGPALVAFHGKALSSTMWLSHLPVLAETHRVHLIDTVGDMNKSVGTAVMATREEVVRWTDTVLEGLRITNAAIVAHSYGAWIATTYAIAQPERVERLALLCPAAVFSAVRPAWLASAIYTHMIRPRTKTARNFISTSITPTTRARLHDSDFGPVIDQYVIGVPRFRGSMQDARPCTYDANALAALTMPVLVIIGADETVCNGPRSAKIAHQRLPNARVELVADANHCAFADQPATVDALLSDFLRE
jgi:pimeloyl-ACP methyl ester carboxylesterase